MTPDPAHGVPEEDDVFAALHGLPGTGAFWGPKMPRAFAPDAEPSDADTERRRRRAERLRRWPAQRDGA